MLFRVFRAFLLFLSFIFISNFAHASNVYKCKIWPTGNPGDYFIETYERQSNGFWIAKFDDGTKGDPFKIEEWSGWLFHSTSGVWASSKPEIISWSINKKTGEYFSVRSLISRSDYKETGEGVCLGF